MTTRRLRSLLCAAFFASFGAGGLVFSAILCLPLPKAAMRAMMRAQFRLFVRAAAATRLFLVDATPGDRAALRRVRGSVVVANHTSLIDVVILVALLGDSVCVTKGAVGANPFMRIIARRALVVNDGPVEVMDRASGYLAEGVNVVVFPEGTRTPADAPEHRFRRGAAHLALRTGAPVVAASIVPDPPTLGKGQAWWDVGARAIRYAVRLRGRVEPPHSAGGGALTEREAAVAFTEEMRRRVFG